MEIHLMFTGSNDILDKCRQPRREIMELASAVVNKHDYGTTIRFLSVNVIFQDIKLIEPGMRLFRKRKEVDVEVELRMDWVRNANVIDIKLALLQCLGRTALNRGASFSHRITQKHTENFCEILCGSVANLMSTIRWGATSALSMPQKSPNHA